MDSPDCVSPPSCLRGVVGVEHAWWGWGPPGFKLFATPDGENRVSQGYGGFFGSF